MFSGEAFPSISIITVDLLCALNVPEGFYTLAQDFLNLLIFDIYSILDILSVFSTMHNIGILFSHEWTLNHPNKVSTNSIMEAAGTLQRLCCTCTNICTEFDMYTLRSVGQSLGPETMNSVELRALNVSL